MFTNEELKILSRISRFLDGKSFFNDKWTLVGKFLALILSGFNPIFVRKIMSEFLEPIFLCDYIELRHTFPRLY